MQTAIVTGASGGIGASLAQQLAKTGRYRVGIIARREPELAKVLASLGSGGHAMAIADLTDVKQVEAAFAKLKADLGGAIDVLVCNAGQGDYTKPSEMTVDDLDTMMRINVHTVVHCVRQVLPDFMKSNSGLIVAVSSVLGRMSTNYLRPSYNAAKHALNAYVESLRFELAASESTNKICVAIASPGPVATDFGTNSGGGPDSRTLAAAQPVEECAGKILAQILERREECYTQDGWWEKILAQYAKWGAPK